MGPYGGPSYKDMFPGILFVRSDALANGNGSSWAHAIPSIKEAIAINWMSEIWVAGGRYNENIALRERMDLYGGFHGAETAREERDWGANETIIDASGFNTTTVIAADNAVLDGFTVTGGKNSGVRCAWTSPTISNCIIEKNSKDGFGGGVECRNSDAAFYHCTIRDNSAERGGGVVCWQDRSQFIHCDIYGNSVTGGGAGVYSEGSSTTFDSCEIRNNEAGYEGGGIECWGGGGIPGERSTERFVNCLITDNKAGETGGGLSCVDSEAKYIHCTIAGNSASRAAGMYVYRQAPEFVNCIIWNRGTEFWHTSSSGYTIFIQHSCVQGGWDGEGNIDAYPLFVDPQNGNYRLQNGSPCIDDGSLEDTPELDIEENLRPGDDGLVDMGAYESPSEFLPSSPLPQSRLYVRAEAISGGDGLSWDTAFNSIKDAIWNISEGGEVWVAAGIYREMVGMREGISIYGGFSGNEDRLEEREWYENQTVINVSGLNCTGVAGADWAVLDGFTITKAEHSGINCEASSPIVSNCIITDNVGGLGGGIRCRKSSPEFYNCLIVNNRTDDIGCGGGVWCGDSTPLFVHCTIADNWADAGGGFCLDGSSPDLRNCIVWNSGREFTSSEHIGFRNLSHCCIQGGWPINETIINEYPFFVDPDHGDYRLQNGSPCIDAGQHLEFSDTSLENRNRLEGDNLVDIGAFESLPEFRPAPHTSPSKRFVRFDAPEDGDGSSWENAFPTINQALRVMWESGEVWVAAGRYNEHVGMEYQIALYAGFAGSETKLDQRDWKANRSIIDTTGFPMSAVSGEDEAILDGFIVTNGLNGVYCMNACPTIRNCKITENHAEFGGGLRCEYSSPYISNCEVSFNHSIYQSGGVYLIHSSPTIENCTIIGNRSDDRFSGIQGEWYSSPSLLNCVITGNYSKVEGSGVCFEGSTSQPLLSNCTIAGNQTDNQYDDQTGILCRDANITIINSIVWDDSLVLPDTGNISATWSNIQDGFDGVGNMNIDPLFVDQTNGDYHLQNGSPCIDTGLVSAAPTEDIEGHNRPGSDGLVDMGAYESPPEYRPVTRTPTPTGTPTPSRIPTPTPMPEEQLPVLASPEAAGITPLTGDMNLWAENGGGSNYWRPEADTLSNGNAIVMGGMRKDPGFSGSAETEYLREVRDMIAIFSPTGELIEPARTAFFTNAGEPWENTICTNRNRDKFYGLCADTVGGRMGERYVVYTIANVNDFPEAFPGYAQEPEAGQAQAYHTAIQVVSNDGIPETPLINPWGDYISEPGLIRGGMVRFLSDGNILVNFEDRTVNGAAKEAFYGSTQYLGWVVGAVIVGPDGSIVKPPFAISNPSRLNSEVRFGLTSGDGWFAIRYEDAVDGPTIVAFDNEGNELGGGGGRVYPAIDIPELEGGGGRNRGDPNGLETLGDLLFVTHRGLNFAGYLTKFRVDETGVTVLKTVRFPDHPLSTFEHNADLGVDSDGNLIVLWQDHSWSRFQAGRWEALARMFDVDLNPLTPSFCMFEVGNNTDVNTVDPILGPGRTKQCRIAMNDEIIIAIAHTNEVPYGDPESFTTHDPRDAFFTYTYISRVLKNPFERGVAVRDWELY
ncbi:MAG: right-handed parallel beta-helix repeat-containing protein [bacterium]